MSGSTQKTLQERWIDDTVDELKLWLTTNSTNITERSPNGETGLHWACVTNDPVKVQLALDVGIYVNADNWRGTSPLIYLAMNGTGIATARVMIENGADPREISGFTGLLPWQTANDKELADYLKQVFEKIEESRKISAIEKLYRNGKWRRQTAHFYSLPKHMRTKQYEDNYKFHPEINTRQTTLEQWRICTDADRKFYRVWCKN